MDAYARTPEGREAGNAAKRRWAKANYAKKKATVAVNNAIRDGRLIRGDCEVCGKPLAQGHHDDYSKPLEVRWLCPEHHAAHHRERQGSQPPPGPPVRGGYITFLHNLDER